MDRTGYARATLATRAGLSAPVPATDIPEPLTMGDMMGAMDHSAHGGASAMDHSMHGGAPAAVDHSAHAGMGTGAAVSLVKPSTTVRHARTEYGPSTDMRVDTRAPISTTRAWGCATTAGAC